jgi:hypothetical protein
MNCISSPALDDSQIIRYVEGESDETVVAHINECAFCSEKASQWALLQNRVKKALYRVSCPTSMELGEYHLGLLPSSQVLVVDKHLRECPLCRREAAELQDFLTAPEAGLLGTLKVLIARLINQTENGYTPASVALRGAAKGPLTFETDGVAITLDVQPDPNGHISLLGQLAADDQDQWTGAKVELQQADSSQLTASMDDLGAFRFEGVYPGAIQITIKSLYDIHVQIPNIDIAL